MTAIIGAIAFSMVIVLSILIICGLPLGELTMGGQYKVFPKNLRILLVSQLILQIFFVLIILQMGGFIPLWFSSKVTKVIGIVMASYLSLNTIMNAISKSKKERYIMTPLSLISSICFWITALNMLNSPSHFREVIQPKAIKDLNIAPDRLFYIRFN